MDWTIKAPEMADTGSTTQKFLWLQSTRTRGDMARGKVQIFSDPEPDAGSNAGANKLKPLPPRSSATPQLWNDNNRLCLVSASGGMRPQLPHRQVELRKTWKTSNQDAASYGNVMVPTRDTVKSPSKPLEISLRMVVETESIGTSVHEVREVMGLYFACC